MPFSHYRAFTIDHTKIPSTQTNFPVVISGTYAWAASVGNGGRSQAAFDIRPFSNSGLTAAYTYQLRNYNATTGAFNMVVLIPSLSASVDTVIYIGIGDPALTTDGSSNAVWDANFKGVWALGDGTTLSLADSTSNAGTLTNTGSATATAGPTGGMGAVSLNGTTQNLFRNAGIITAEPVTLEALYNPADNTTSGDFVASGSSSNATSLRSLTKRLTNVLRTSHFGTGTSTQADSTSAYVAGAWNYGAATFTSVSSRDSHANGGTKVNSATNITACGAPNRFCIGARMSNGVTNNFYAGSVGEVRLSNIVRADDWIKTTDANLRGIASFYSVGSEVAVGGASYTLSAATGSFVLTGNSAGLSAARKLAADVGAFTLTGNAAALRATRVLGANTGIYTLSGSPVGLRAGRRLGASTGVYILTGAAANLRTARRLAALPGVFVLTGYTAGLSVGNSAAPAVYYVVGAVSAVDRPLTCSAVERSLTVAAADRPLAIGAVDRPLTVIAL